MKVWRTAACWQRRGGIFLLKKKRKGNSKFDSPENHEIDDQERFHELFFFPFSMLGAHSCTLGCGNTLTHCKMHSHFRAIPAACPPPLLHCYPSWLRPLLPLVFLSRSLYLPPMAESGRATGSKTRRLQNVGQPSVLSYRLETAVCVCGPLALRAQRLSACS